MSPCPPVPIVGVSRRPPSLFLHPPVLARLPLRRLCLIACIATSSLHLAHAADTPAAPLQRAGTAKIVKGQVRAFDGKTERVLQPGDGVFPAERVTATADSAASLVLRDGTLMVVGPDSSVELREFAFDSTTYQGNMLVEILRGTMRMVSGLIRKTRSDAVRIETPTAVIGIRGTDFIVDVEPNEVAK